MVANEILERLLGWANQLLPEEEIAGGGYSPRFELPMAALIVPSRFIGDNILLTPFIRNLRRNMAPGARLDIVTTPATHALFETSPWLDETHPEKEGPTRNPKSFLEAHGYDTLVFARYSLAWASAAVRADIPQRVGYDLERLGLHRLQRWGRSLTHPIRSAPVSDSGHQVENYLDMLRQLGLRVWDNDPECPLTALDHKNASLTLNRVRGRPKILIQAGAGSPGKQWPEENWRTLLTLIRREWPDAVFLAVGGNKEQILYESLAEVFPITNLCGKTSLRESIALMSRLDLIITLDTSVAHLAALAGTPRLVVLYGPTNEAKWAPRVRPGVFLSQVHLDLPCRPCMTRTCGHKSCILHLGPEQVFRAVRQSFTAKPMPA